MATHENSSYIWQLDRFYPDGVVDKVYNGDDELKQIKDNLLNTFPNITTVLNASSTELNLLVGQTVIGDLFPMNASQFVRADANSAPTVDSTYDIGTALLKFSNIYSDTFQGNATSATVLETARTITVTGDVTGSTSFDGSGNVSITATVGNDSHTHEWNNIVSKPSTFTPTTENVQDIVGAMTTGNTESGITVTYQDADGTLDFNVNDPSITLTGDVTGSAVMTNLGNVSITATVANDSHTHAYSNLTGVPASFTPTTESVQDIVGAMVSSNSELGISVTYNDTNGVLDFNVSDPVITLAGDVSGSATMANLGNVTITATVANDSHTHTYSNLTSIPSTFEPVTESVQDIVGAMVSSNTESGIAVTYNDTTGKLDFASSGATDDEAVQDIVGAMLTGNVESGIAVTYDDVGAKINFDVNDPLITLSGDCTGSATMTNLGNVTITTVVGNDSHSHAYGNLTGIPSTFTPATETVQDIVGAMLSGNGESGIAVTYQDTDGTIDFNVVDPVITLSGDVDGTATMTNLGDVNIACTVDNNSHTHLWSNISDKPSTFAPVTETVQDIVGSMVGSNTEAGISVTYDDTDGTLDFNVSDPVIGLSGDVTGSATMTNLGNVTIAAAVANDSHDHTYLKTSGVTKATAVSGGLNVTGTGTATVNWTVSSDQRLKEDITVIPNALDKVDAIGGYTYTRNDLNDTSAEHVGVIAQEVQKVLPQVVNEDADGMLSVSYGSMNALLIEAIKELRAEVNALKEAK